MSLADQFRSFHQNLAKEHTRLTEENKAQRQELEQWRTMAKELMPPAPPPPPQTPAPQQRGSSRGG